MAIKFANYPKAFETNKCYRALLLDHKKGISQWSSDVLVKEFGKAEFQQLLTHKYIIANRAEQTKLAFAVSGTIASFAKKYTLNDVLLFTELKEKLKLDKTALVNLLIYLMNFNQVQTLNLPGCGLTIVTADSEHMEAQLDWIFCLSDYLS